MSLQADSELIRAVAGGNNNATAALEVRSPSGENGRGDSRASVCARRRRPLGDYARNRLWRMKTWLARLIAYVFIGSFCIAGPLLLCVSLGTAAQRAMLVYSGLRAEGTVIAKRQTGGSRRSYAPVFQFTASDGRSHVVSSDVYGRESAFRFGEHVNVLYPRGRPEAARIDAFAPLWTLPLVFGVVGAAFSVIPALILAQRLRRRTSPQQTGASEPTPDAGDSAASAVRWVLAPLLVAGGLALLAVGAGVVAPERSSADESRVVITSLGVLLASCGVLLGKWVAVGGRLYNALGASAMTAMAVVFGWVALYGEAANFSGGVSIGGVGVSAGGSVTLARIAFGFGACIFALASLWAWKQVLRQRG